MGAITKARYDKMWARMAFNAAETWEALFLINFEEEDEPLDRQLLLFEEDIGPGQSGTMYGVTIFESK